MQQRVNVDEGVLGEFLSILFKGCEGYAYALSYKHGSFKNDWKRVQEDLDPIVDAIRVVNESKSTCAYISANLFSPQNTHGRKVEDVQTLRALVVDIDFWSDEPGVRNHGKKSQCVPEGYETRVDELLQELQKSGKLSFVVDTGHGRQAWLLLPDPWRIETEDARSRANALSKGFSQFVRQQFEHVEIQSGVDGSPDIAHIWRIPGTVNRKGETPVPVAFSLRDNGTRMEAEEIKALLKESGIELQQEPVQRSCDFPDVLSPLSGEGLERLEVACENHSGLQALWEGDAKKAKALMPEINDTTGSGCMFHFARVLARELQWQKTEVGQAIATVAQKNKWRQHSSRVHSILKDLFDCKEKPASSPRGSGGESTGHQKKKPERDLLKEIAEREYSFVSAGENEVFAVPRGGNQRALSIHSEYFKGHLHTVFSDEQGKVPGLTSVNAILPSLLFMARQGGQSRIWRRVAMPNNSTIVVDLYQKDHKGRCVVITPNGWEVQESWPAGVVFDTSETMAELPTPVRGTGSLDDIRRAIGMTGSCRDEQWRLLVAFLIATLIPRKDHPILVCEGKPASGKSFALSQIRRLIDPQGMDDDDSGTSIPSRPSDLAGKVRGEFFIVFDNVGGIPRGVSDELCQMVDFSYKIQTRRLYKTAKIATFFGPVFVGVSMIGTSETPPDLLGRVLRFHFNSPKDGWELSRGEAVGTVSRSRPGAMADLYDLCAKVLSELPHSKPTEPHRLEGFLEVLTALDSINGWQTAKSFIRASSAVQRESVEELPFTILIQKVLSESCGGEFSGTLREFLRKLTGPANSHHDSGMRGVLADSGVIDSRGLASSSRWLDDNKTYQPLASKVYSWLQKHSRALEAAGIHYEKLGGRPPEWRFWLERDADDQQTPAVSLQNLPTAEVVTVEATH